MNSTQLTHSQDRFGRQVAARLAAGAQELPYEVTERLRAARMQALAKHKRVLGLRVATSVSSSAGGATMTADEPVSLWNRIASVLPIIAVLAGLVLIHTVQNERRAAEVAEVDAALLTDDLPPSAYADPGFIQFLKQSGKE
jgi:hypothetical protein